MNSVLAALIAASGTPSLDPTDSTGLPGYGELTKLANGIGSWALIASIVAILAGGVMWAFGHFSHNYQQALNGRKGVIVAAVAALLIGGSSQIINFFYSAGHNI
ncbi:MAG TPA: DUF6112 family protein [Acidimicrobiales bacterium]|nr:DUF6112 family protein [Acidimicrobiales bacterium]